MRKLGSSRLFGRKLNNGGMSLVEVIIAITILSVVIVPVMQALTSAAFYNAKARKRQDVMLVAESLMEVFKGYDLVAADDNPDAECLVKMFDGSSLDILDKIGADQAEDGSTSISCIEPENPQDPNGVYTFKIDNLQAEKSIYNVEITATPAGESKVYELDNVSPDKDLIFNGGDNKNYSNDDIIEAIKDDFEEKYASKFLEALGEDAYNSSYEKIESIDDIELNGGRHIPKLTLVSRKTTYTVEEDSGSAKLTIAMECNYKVEPYTYYVPKEESSEGSGDDSTEEHGDIDVDREDEEDVEDESEYEYEKAQLNGSSKEGSSKEGISGIEGFTGDVTLTAEPSEVSGSLSGDLERVFIYYYPLYKRNSWYGDAIDEINIENKTGNNIECYLIKQRVTDVSDISLENLDRNYKVGLSGDKSIILYHNLNNFNFKSELELENFASESGFAPRDKVDNGKIGGGLRKNKVLAYTLEMTITDSNTGAEVAKLEGSMSERLKNIAP